MFLLGRKHRKRDCAMFKRILACLMVLLTLVSYLPPRASAEETQPQEETTEVSATQPSEPETVPTEPTAAAEETTAPTEETSPDETSSDETLPEEALVDTYALPGDDGAVASGKCGENLTWSIDAEGGSLTISGTGAMWDYSEIFVGDGDSHTTAPWYAYSPTKLVLEKGITYIGEYAFFGCGIAGDLTLPDGVTEVGANAFAYCSGLTSVVLSQSVAWLDNWAFLNCSGISSLTMPKGVTGIGYAAFRGCGSLTSVTIPASVIDINSAAFSDCNSLENIAVDGKNIYYISVDGVLFNKNRTTLVAYPSGKKGTAYTIPKGVTSIGANAFSYCRNLIDVTIPENVTSIGGRL